MRTRGFGYSLVGAVTMAIVASSSVGCSDDEAASSGTSSDGGSSAGSGGSGGATGSGGSAGSGGGAGTSGGANYYVDQLRSTTDACLPRSLNPGAPGTAEDGRIGCAIFELTTAACDCTRPGRSIPGAAAMEAVQSALLENGFCGDNVGIECSAYCGCEIIQLAGTAGDTSSDLYSCQNQVTLSDPSLAGFCLIDSHRTDANGAPAPLGSAELVADCPETSRRRLRFVGEDTPTQGSIVFLACGG